MPQRMTRGPCVAAMHEQRSTSMPRAPVPLRSPWWTPEAPPPLPLTRSALPIVPLAQSCSHGHRWSSHGRRALLSPFRLRPKLSWPHIRPPYLALPPPHRLFDHATAYSLRPPELLACCRHGYCCSRGQATSGHRGPSRAVPWVRAALLMLHHHSTAADEPPSAGNDKSGMLLCC